MSQEPLDDNSILIVTKDGSTRYYKHPPDAPRPAVSMREARLRKKAKLREVADYVGVAVGTVAHWEQGDTYPSVEHFSRLLKFYEMKWGELKWK